MSFGREVKRRAKSAVPPLVLLAVAGYFGWSATQGDHGLQGVSPGSRISCALHRPNCPMSNGEVEMLERRVNRVAQLPARPVIRWTSGCARCCIWRSRARVVVMYGQGKKLF